MMITARGKERPLPPHALRNFKAQNIAIKTQGPLQIGDLEMHMTDANAGMDRFA